MLLRLIRFVRLSFHFPGPESPRNLSYAIGRGWISLSLLLFATCAGADQKFIVIEQQSLTQALTEFAQKTGLQLVYPSELTESLEASGANGAAPQAILEQLLSGTGLTFEYLNTNTITLIKKNDDKRVIDMSHDTHDGRILPTDERTGFASSFLGRMIAAIAAGLTSGGASAEQAAISPDTGVIEEIVVTAQRRSESIQDVAASISAVTGQQLGDRGIRDIQDLQYAVPSLQYEDILGNSGVTIRGVGSFANSPGTAVTIDGVYQPQANMSRLSQLDIERVEVLRGPQGTLYGRNANAGAVNFISAAPSEAFVGQLKVGYAEYEESSIQGVMSGALSDRLRVRTAVDYRDRNRGFVENVQPNQPDQEFGDFTTGRLRVAFDASDSLSMDLQLAIVQSTGPTTPAYLPVHPLDATTTPYVEDALVVLEPWRTSDDGFADSDRDYELASLSLNWDLSFGTLKSVTAYQSYDDKFDSDRDGVNLPILQVRDEQLANTLTQEFNLGISQDNFDWVLGAFYMDDERERFVFFDLPTAFFGLPPNAYINFDVPNYDTRSQALFADVTWSVSEDTRILAGIRYSEDKLEAQHRNDIGLQMPDGGRQSLIETCPRRTLTPRWSSTTWRAGVQRDLTEQSNAYLTVSSGFKAGGVAIFECTPSFKPEEIVAYEIGYKSQHFDGTLVLNSSIFYYDYTDFQLVQTIGLATRTTNAATADVMGVEIESKWRPDPNWLIEGSLALLDATYGSFVSLDGLNPGAGEQNLSGNYLNRAPKVSLNLGIAHIAPRAWGTTTFRLDVGYRSKMYFREFNSSLDAQDSYTVISLNAIWDDPSNRYTVRLFADNLTDEDYLISILGAAANGGRFGSYGTPRQLGAEITLRF